MPDAPLSYTNPEPLLDALPCGLLQLDPENRVVRWNQRLQLWTGLTFATVRGAGHMVPATRPEAALELFTRGVLGKGF